MPRELTRPVLPERRRPRRGAVAAGALLVLLTAGWAIAGRSDARRTEAAGVEVEYSQPADVDAAYRDATGAHPEPKVGPSGCGRGEPDERSWSRPDDPDRVVGRFTCRIVAEHAEMWWTDGDALAHAVAPDADLAALFAWWKEQ